MKKKERKAFEQNILTAFKEVLKNNTCVQTKKTEKAVKKSIKKIANMKFKKYKIIYTKKIENETLSKNNS